MKSPVFIKFSASNSAGFIAVRRLLYAFLAITFVGCLPPKSTSRNKAGSATPSGSDGSNGGGQISAEASKLFDFLSDDINRRATQKLNGKHVHEAVKMFGEMVYHCIAVSAQAGKCTVYQNFGTPKSYQGTCAARIHGSLIGIFCKKENGDDCVPHSQGRPDTTGAMQLSEKVEDEAPAGDDTGVFDPLEDPMDPKDPREEALKLLDKPTFKNRWNATFTIDNDSCNNFMK